MPRVGLYGTVEEVEWRISLDELVHGGELWALHYGYLLLELAALTLSQTRFPH